MSRRVVITGVGLVSPVGHTADESWRNVVNGRSGLGLITRFDASSYSSSIAGEVRGFCAERWMSARDAALSDPFLHYAIASASMALDDSKLLEDSGSAARTGVCIATGVGGHAVLLRQQAVLLARGPRYVSPMTIPFSICNMASGYVSIKFKLEGPSHTLVSACASGASAIGEAFHTIQRGGVDAMVAGASDAIVPLHVAGFASAQALAPSSDRPPEQTSRPFDSLRSGFVMSEGAGVLVLEERQRALDRGAPVYGELVGYGSCSDAHHITAPEPSGRGAVRAMREAMTMAGVDPCDIGYVNAHATSTLLGDRVEVAALRQVFGSALDHVPVSSTKSTTGHMLGAAGSAEAIFCLLAMRDGMLPPTVNQEVEDPTCAIDTIPNVARRATVDHILSNSFGFGGHNVSLLFKRAS